ncbi:MAG TPA: enoyl-ACP reductase [Candidatus Angelobacter sp.]
MLTMQGRNAVVCGVANKRSIAWAIAQRLSDAGAKIAITYLNERLKEEAQDLITSLPSATGFQCDANSDAEVERLASELKQNYGRIDVLVHSIAFAPTEELKGDFLNTSREGFQIALNTSAYSLIALSRAVAPLMTDGGSIMTLTHLGAERVMPSYNVMGVAKAALEATVRYLASSLGPRKIRVNAISAGPIKTLSARAIAGFGEMLKAQPERAPLKRNVEVKEVGDTALFLASDLSTGITGEIIFVDCGYNIMGF